jgi:hypothetical protein
VAIAGGTLLTTMVSFYFVPALFRLVMSKQAKAVNSSSSTPELALLS